MKPLRIALLACVLAQPAVAQEASDDEACFAPATPVVALGFPSRYAADSKTRSDFDEAGDAAVTAALKPIDDFIADLARISNRAQSREGEAATLAADCVLDHIATWAKADALSDLKTDTAKMSVPSRVGGIAFAYANALPFASDDPARRDVIEGWLRARALQTIAFFDAYAPPRVNRNNLRAWAALAVARIGLTLDDARLTGWADISTRLVVCSINADGSLPMEMQRGDLALHYQLHAVGPLVLTAALLDAQGADLFSTCDRAIPRAVSFVLQALDDPALVQAHAGVEQSFAKGDEKLDAFEVAWAQAYLAFVDDPEVAALAARYDGLSNSKFGGDQSLLW
jgi:poly(beta-D-mannuronate) lyase